MDITAIRFHKIFHDGQTHASPNFITAVITFCAKARLEDLINGSFRYTMATIGKPYV